MALKAYITPSVLLWARKRAGYTAEQAAAKLNPKRVSPEMVKAWETGTEQRPTYAQLRKMADMYRLPLAAFYLPAPPKEETASKKAQIRLMRHYA